MNEQSHSVPEWPVVELVMEPDGSGSVNGRRVRLPGQQDPHAELFLHAVVYARTLGRPVRVRATSTQGAWQLIAHPDGELTTLRRPHPSADGWVGDPVAPKPEPPAPAPSVPVPPVGSVTAVRNDGTRPAETEPQAAPSAESLRKTAVATVPDLADDSPPEQPSTAAWAFSPSVAAVEQPPPSGWTITAPETSSPREASLGAGLQATALQRSTGAVQKGATRRPIPLGAVIGSTAGIVVLLAAALLTVPRSSPAPRPAMTTAAGSATSTPSNRATSVSRTGSQTVAAPVTSPPALAAAAPGYQTQPLWAYDIDGDSLVDVGPGGLIATRTPDGQVIGLDPATGQPRWWTTDTYGPDWVGPHLTRIDGQSVVALTGRDQLLFWAVHADDAAHGPIATKPTSVPLPVGAQLAWGGPSPLVVLGTSSAGVIHAGALQLVSLPSGAHPLVADGTDVLAAQGATWLRIAAGAAPTTHTIAAPAGVTGAPVKVEAVAADYLAAIWAKPRKGTQTVALIDVATGKTLISTRLPAGVDSSRASTVRQVGGSIVGIGACVVDTNIKRLKVLLAQYKIISLTPGHVYAQDTTSQHTVDIRTANLQFQVAPVPDGAAVPFGTVTAGTPKPLALIATTTPTGSVLQALPATS